MKRASKLLAVAATLLLSSGPLSADGYHEHGHGHWHDSDGHMHQNLQVQRVTVTISCFRGPWQDVIWDRPEPVFVDSLVAAGYTFPEAHAISERVCRDIDGVDNPGHSQAVLAQIFRESPPHATHRHLSN